MMLPAGQLNNRITILKRSITGAQLGAYETAGDRWGNFRQLSETDLTVGNFGYTSKGGVLVLRADAMARALNPSYQVRIDGELYEVRAAGWFDQTKDMVRIDVASAPGRQAYADYVNRRGETVVVRRRTGGAVIDAPARARIDGYSPAELVAGINQGDRRVLVLVEDLEKAGWPLPLRRLDRLVIRGRELNVEDVDDNTHRHAGVLAAYQVRATG
jgi:hypothetical protein